MKNFKRILAAIGAVLLFGMYASTLLFAFIDHSKSLGLLKASIACTIILPVLIYAYTLVYRISRRNLDEFNHLADQPDHSEQSPNQHQDNEDSNDNIS